MLCMHTPLFGTICTDQGLAQQGTDFIVLPPALNVAAVDEFLSTTRSGCLQCW
jgi:hypothetical protein